MNDDLISRQAAVDALKKEQAHYSHEDGVEIFYEYNHAIEALKNLPSAQSEIVRCWECVYRRRCMLQHFVESNAVDGTKIDWSQWYCADGVRDISKSDERLE